MRPPGDRFGVVVEWSSLSPPSTACGGGELDGGLDGVEIPRSSQRYLVAAAHLSTTAPVLHHHLTTTAQITAQFALSPQPHF